MVFSKSYHVPNNYYFHKGCTVTALDGQLLLADILGAISLHLPIIDYFLMCISNSYYWVALYSQSTKTGKSNKSNDHKSNDECHRKYHYLTF